MESLIDYHGFGWRWVYDQPFSNFDPDATLSAASITVEEATASSPTHVLLFNKGTFRGQGTPEAGAFVTILKDESTDDTLVVQFKIPGESHAGPPKSLHRIEYKSIDGTIYWSGDWPVDELGKPPGFLPLSAYYDRKNGPPADN